MNAADVLHEAWPGIDDDDDEGVAALLAHGEQGVAITGDGKLWKLDAVDGHLNTYRLVPLSAEAGDTDG